MSSEKSVEVQVETEMSPSKTLKRNETLERESLGCCSLLFYSNLFLALDVWKQVTSYGMKYFNNHIYPMPQTQVVAITETFKFISFIFIVWWSSGLVGLRSIKISMWYAVPSLIYAFNNNIYYYALHFVTPPIWNILIQLRIVFTALTYRTFFKRPVSSVQWAGIVLIIIALTLTQFSGGQTLIGQNHKIVVAIILAVLGSCTSVIGTVTMEYLFKNDNRSFQEMQLQLYGFGTCATWTLFALESSTREVPEIKGDPALINGMLGGCIALSCLSGVAVAFIVKKLDNIVKLYTQALSNMLTSVACTWFFPDHFHLNIAFFGCLVLLFIAISLYESKNLDLKSLVADMHAWFANSSLRDRILVFVVAPVALSLTCFLIM